MTTVTINVQTDDMSPAVIPGIVVEIFDLSAIYQTGGTTDSGGQVVVSLPDGSYDVTFFKIGISILPKQPQRIIVDHTLSSNSFLVTAHVRTLPESVDPLKCRITGNTVGADGSPSPARLIFSIKKEFIIRQGSVLTYGERVEYQADVDGKFDFELYRSTKYEGFVMNMDQLFGKTPPKLDIEVPDAPALELSKLLFPAPVDFDFSVGSISILITDGVNQTITYDVFYEDGSIRSSVPWATVKLTNTDDTVVDASLLGGMLVLNPKKVGTATITTTIQLSDDAIYDPAPSYASDSVVVTVS